MIQKQEKIIILKTKAKIMNITKLVSKDKDNMNNLSSDRDRIEELEKKLRIQEERSKELWDLLLNSYSDVALSNALCSENDYNAWFKLLNVAVDRFLVIATVKDTPGNEMPDSVIKAINEAGFKRFNKELWSTYIGVINKGKVLNDESASNEQKLSYRYESLDGDFKIIAVSEPWRNGNRGDIKIDDIEYAVNIRGINIVIYDTATRQVIDSIGFDSHECSNITFQHNQQLKRSEEAESTANYYAKNENKLIEKLDLLNEKLRYSNNTLKLLEKSVYDEAHNTSGLITNLISGSENTINKKIQELMSNLEKRILSDLYEKFCLLTNLVAKKKSDCLVSVIVPVYNVEEYLRETLFSIINQNFNSWEMICVNDCSTDKSMEILNTFSRIDSRISIINLSENRGAGYARNIGIAKAKGEYLAILDADDIYDQNYLRNMVYTSVNTGADITVCRSRKLNEKEGNKIEPMLWSIRKEQIPKTKIFRPCNFSEYVFQAFVGWSWDKLFRKDFIDKYDLKFQEIRSTNDAYFVFLSLCYASTITTIEDNLVIHRYHSKSLAATRKKQPDCFAVAIRAIYEKLRSNEKDWNQFNQSFLNWVIDLSYWHYSTIDEECKPEIISELKKIAEDFKIFENLKEIYNENMLSWVMANEIQVSSVPYVSVVIPLYNQENYLCECLDSLVKQTLKNIEIIIVNDGSTDSSLYIAREYANTDSRIVIIDKDNSGYGDTMNIGIAKAKGQYIGIVEPDDFIDLNMYEELYIKARCKNLDFVKSDFYRFVKDENGSGYKYDYIELDKTKKFYNKVLKPEDNLDVFRLVMNTWTGIYNADFLRKFNIKHNVTSGASFQDNGFWFQTFCNASRVYFVNKAYYRNRRDNINSSVKSKGKVYSFSDEYSFIHKFLNSLEPERKAKFLKPYFLKLFHNYNFNLCRIDESFREEFAKFASEQFREFKDNGELDMAMFSENEKSRVDRLIMDSRDYLFNEVYR